MNPPQPWISYKIPTKPKYIFPVRTATRNLVRFTTDLRAGCFCGLSMSRYAMRLPGMSFLLLLLPLLVDVKSVGLKLR